jgi:hypothetical protein
MKLLPPKCLKIKHNLVKFNFVMMTFKMPLKTSIIIHNMYILFIGTSTNTYVTFWYNLVPIKFKSNKR